MPPTNDKFFKYPEVRVVEASAGSGKTYALAKRYLQLLLNPDLKPEQIPIRTILAITFTNKAAFEMKARILEFLKRLSLGQLNPEIKKDILDPLGIDYEKAQKKAAAIMEDIIHNYNFFQVQTIDKFINTLLSGCAFKVGLTSNFKIKTNSFEYLEYALDELIDKSQHQRDLKHIFEEFLHHYLYIEGRSGWFPKEDMLQIVYRLFQENNAYGLKFKDSPISSEMLIKSKKVILEKMKELKECLPAETDARFTKSLDSFLNDHKNGFDVDRLSDYFFRLEAPLRKDAKCSDKVEKTWKAIRSLLVNLCEDEACSLFNPYILIFYEVLKELYLVCGKDDVLFLDELNKRASYLFDESYVTVEELYYRLATRFRHYLVDEFQDTSRLQWHNLEKMIEEALSTGGTLFYVGDRKQAIYGFRGGDVALFDYVKKRFGPFNVALETLSHNWRSQKAIVDFNNAIFSEDNLKNFILEKQKFESQKKKTPVILDHEEIKEITEIFSASQQTAQKENDAGYVEIQYIDIEKKDERDEHIREKLIERIKELKTRFSYRDIAILSRGNFEIEQMTGWLLEEKIPVESERTSNVKEHHLIKEIIAFLQFLNSPIDNLAFSQFILGDLFAKASGIANAELHDFVFSLRDKIRAQHDVYVYTEFREAYPQAWDELIDEFFRNVGLYPVYELLVSIFGRLQVLKSFPESQGFFMHLLEITKTQEEEHGDLSSFLDYLDHLQGEDLYVHVTDSDAIKMLTIHKAKGLEFPVVIVPFLGMDVEVGSGGGDQKQSYILQRVEDEMELLRLKGKYINFSEKLKKIYETEYKKAFISELNNVYVALTRPQLELYAFIPHSVGRSHNLLKYLIPTEHYKKGEVKRYALIEKSKGEIIQLKSGAYQDWIQYLKDEFMPSSELQYRKERIQGQILHSLLSGIGNVHQKNLDEAIEAVFKQMPAHLLSESTAVYKTWIKKVLKEEKLKPFFEVQEGVVKVEMELVNVAGHSKRIDRLIITPTEVWVVDYKSKKDLGEGYVEQVRGYLKIIKEIYPHHRHRGFLIYLDTLELEEVNDG